MHGRETFAQGVPSLRSTGRRLSEGELDCERLLTLFMERLLNRPKISLLVSQAPRQGHPGDKSSDSVERARKV